MNTAELSFNEMPQEIQQSIFSDLDEGTRKSARLVCASWNGSIVRIASREAFIKVRKYNEFIMSQFPHLKPDICQIHTCSYILISKNFMDIALSVQNLKERIIELLKTLKIEELTALDEAYKRKPDSVFFKSLVDVVIISKKRAEANLLFRWERTGELCNIFKSLMEKDNFCEALDIVKDVVDSDSDDSDKRWPLHYMALELLKKNEFQKALFVAKHIKGDHWRHFIFTEVSLVCRRKGDFETAAQADNFRNNL